MKIKDIVNRDLVNLTNCEQEPIHIPGCIQPHGFLVAVDESSFTIEYCSANIFEFIGLTYDQCLNKHFSGIFGSETQALLVDHTVNLLEAIIPPFLVTINGKDLLCSLHKSGHFFVAEFEPSDVNVPHVAAVYDRTIQFVNYMERADSLQELCQKVAEQTRAMTGYDRVMVYRFDKDYNGEVIAECRTNGAEAFLGLHYPHTDIPAQARKMYLTNLMRIITDIEYTPVPIYTIDDIAEKNLDLSCSGLRSVSPIHIQYLRNMGVSGTFTISLIHKGRLWGLITCHHFTPKYVPLYERIAAQLQGYFLTSQIDVRQQSEAFKEAKKVNESLANLLEVSHLPDALSFFSIIKQPHLLLLCNASGVAIVFEGKLFINGVTPEVDDIKKLASWLKTYSNQVYNTSVLVDIYPDAKKFSATGAGIIYHSLGGLQDDCIIWFAPETLEEVNWAGDPGNAIISTEKGLTPRNSFQLWKQVVKYQSRDWSDPEILATASFVHTLQKHINLILISEEEKKQRTISAQLFEANAELDNISWISSHDLMEPLRKIQVFSSKILNKEYMALSDSVVEMIKKMNKSASRMQQLLADIASYSKVRLTQDTFVEVNLMGLLSMVEVDLANEISQKQAHLSYENLPVIKGTPFLLTQLFVNLLRNSMKFSKKGVKPIIKITGQTSPVAMPRSQNEHLFNMITVSDNGVGFDPSHNESIFKVFTRLHRVDEFEGTGVGLALCKKIMQNHNGFIFAEGTADGGAVFNLYFPL